MPRSDHPEYTQLTDGTFLQQVEHHATLSSTNDYASRIATRNNLATPAMVICDTQTDGRGRGKNRWQSSTKNLAFSLIVDLPESITTENFLLVSPLISLAICEALQTSHSADDFQIKWPNDVYVCERKIAGILIESSQTARRWIIGCGINVNEPASSLSDKQSSSSDVHFQPISLIDLTQQPIDRICLLRHLLGGVARFLKRLEMNDESLITQIRSRCFLTEKNVTLSLPTTEISGRCLGISHRGALLLETPEGTKSFFSGTIKSIQNG